MHIQKHIKHHPSTNVSRSEKKECKRSIFVIVCLSFLSCLPSFLPERLYLDCLLVSWFSLSLTLFDESKLLEQLEHKYVAQKDGRREMKSFNISSRSSLPHLIMIMEMKLMMMRTWETSKQDGRWDEVNF